jgi:DNA-binding transcriptional regulator YiaG
LGIGQRQIQVSRGYIPTGRKPRKSFPTAINTLGDAIRVGRKNKGMLRIQLAVALGVSIGRIESWEHDRQTPNDMMLETLSLLLDLPERFEKTKANS